VIGKKIEGEIERDNEKEINAERRKEEETEEGKRRRQRKKKEIRKEKENGSLNDASRKT
jgi:hypothetical protein